MHSIEMLRLFERERHQRRHQVRNIGPVPSDQAQRALGRFHFTVGVIGKEAVKIAFNLLDPNGIRRMKKPEHDYCVVNDHTADHGVLPIMACTSAVYVVCDSNGSFAYM